MNTVNRSEGEPYWEQLYAYILFSEWMMRVVPVSKNTPVFLSFICSWLCHHSFVGNHPLQLLWHSKYKERYHLMWMRICIIRLFEKKSILFIENFGRLTWHCSKRSPPIFHVFIPQRRRSYSERSIGVFHAWCENGQLHCFSHPTW